MASQPDVRAVESAVDKAKLEAFLERAIGDFGGAVSAALVVIGDRLGLYKAMAGAPPMSSSELAAHTGTHERYVREWLVNQAAGGYIQYDPETGKYSLPARACGRPGRRPESVFCRRRISGHYRDGSGRGAHHRRLQNRARECSGANIIMIFSKARSAFSGPGTRRT